MSHTYDCAAIKMEVTIPPKRLKDVTVEICRNNS